MTERFLEYVKQNNLIEQGDNVGVAVSGGSDSVALLHLLHESSDELGINIYALHVEHGIRGEDSINDMKFTQQLCDKLNIPLCFYQANISKTPGVNLEQLARNIRYGFFNKCIEKYNLDKVAIAHHMNDRVETALLNLIRGSGMDGFCSMRIKRDKFIRPLLCFTKEEITSYLTSNNLSFVEDLSNKDTKYSRNKIRADILPKMSEINSDAVRSISRAIDLTDEENRFLDALAGSELEKIGLLSEKDITLNIPELSKLDTAIARRVIRLAMKQVFSLDSFEHKHLEQVLTLLRFESSKAVDLPFDLQCSVEYNNLHIKQNDYYVLDPKNYFVLYEYVKSADFKNKAGNCEYLDPASFPAKPLELRTRVSGDYIYPFGMRGKKKLKDYLSDKKIPADDRNDLLLLADGNEVYVIFSVGISGRCALTPQTEKILKLSLEQLG